MTHSRLPSVMSSLLALVAGLGRRRQWQLGGLVVLMVAASVSEVVSIGAVLPFLAVLTAPEELTKYAFTRDMLSLLGAEAPSDALLPLTIVFVVAALLAGAVRLLLTWASTRYAFSVGTELSCDLYRRTLHQPLIRHLGRNSSEVVTAVVTKVTMVVNNTLLPALTLVSSSLIFAAVLFALTVVNVWISIGSLLGFGSIYFTIAAITRRRKIENGRVIAEESGRVVKTLQEGLGGIREILIDGSQPAYCKAHAYTDHPLRRAQGSNQFLAQGPRYVVEALGMTVIAAVAYLMASGGAIASSIPVLGAFAVAAQRLLPLMQQSYAAWSTILGGQPSLRDVLRLLAQPAPDASNVVPVAPLPFVREIRLDSLSFRYADDLPWVLQNVNCVIPKGGRIGVIGPTGGGKSTLLDVLMGLLDPTDGNVLIDGRVLGPTDRSAWFKHISHVPQTVFLSDDSVAANIAFGVPPEERDAARVRHAARQAQLHDVIESWPQGYATQVGERGVRLSGGQRQRIGLARALYKQADVIVLDEATSALDDDTERAVISAIEALSDDITVIMIAHRTTTLRSCTQVIDLHEGRVARVGTYEQVVLRSQPEVPA